MKITKKELYEYIMSTIRDNLQYDDLVQYADSFGDTELEIMTNDGKTYTIKIVIEGDKEVNSGE